MANMKMPNIIEDSSRIGDKPPFCRGDLAECRSVEIKSSPATTVCSISIAGYQMQFPYVGTRAVDCTPIRSTATRKDYQNVTVTEKYHILKLHLHFFEM